MGQRLLPTRNWASCRNIHCSLFTNSTACAVYLQFGALNMVTRVWPMGCLIGDLLATDIDSHVQRAAKILFVVGVLGSVLGQAFFHILTRINNRQSLIGTVWNNNNSNNRNKGPHRILARTNVSPHVNTFQFYPWPSCPSSVLSCSRFKVSTTPLVARIKLPFWRLAVSASRWTPLRLCLFVDSWGVLTSVPTA